MSDWPDGWRPSDDGTYVQAPDNTSEAELRKLLDRLHGDRDKISFPGETRIVDPETGGAKGQKLARFDLIPSDVLWELAEHYGKGNEKYPPDETGLSNWQRGYDWRLSVAALQRHLHAWLMGADTDPETGSSHLIAVIWHATALRWFQKHGKGRDFRRIA